MHTLYHTVYTPNITTVSFCRADNSIHDILRSTSDLFPAEVDLTCRLALG